MSLSTLTAGLTAGATTGVFSPSPSPPSARGSHTASPSPSLSSLSHSLSLSSFLPSKPKVARGPCVIIELGEAWTKVGLGGECAPRHIIDTKSLIGRARTQRIGPIGLNERRMPHSQCTQTTHEQPDSTSSSSTAIPTPSDLHDAAFELSISRILLRNPLHLYSEWCPLLQCVLRVIYFQYLDLNPKDRRVVCVEQYGWSHAFKRALVSAFTELDVPAVCMVRASEAALYCSMPLLKPVADSPHFHSSSSGIIIDVGWSETRFLIVYLGHPLLSLVRLVPLGVWDAHRAFKRSLRRHLRNEYQQLGGDTEEAYYVSEEERMCERREIERMVATMTYVQPMQLALDAYQNEAGEQPPLSSEDGSAIPPPLPHIPASSAATDLPPPLPIPFATHAAPPPPASGDRPPPMALPSTISLPPEMRYELWETLFQFDRCGSGGGGGGGNASARTQRAEALAKDCVLVPSAQSHEDVSIVSGSTSESSLSSELLDLITDPQLGPEVRATVISNIVLMGGGSMVAGFAERLIDEVNWMLGGNTTHEQTSRARAQRISKCGMQAMQNKLYLNPCSSAVASKPRAHAMGSATTPQPSSSPHSAAAAIASGSATTTSSLPTPPPLASPFPASLLGWIGSSLVSTFDLSDDSFLSLSELEAYTRDTNIDEAEVQRRVRQRMPKKRLQRIQPIKQEEEKNVDETTTSSTEAAAPPPKLVAVPPPVFPDWSHPDSLAARSASLAAAAAAAAANTGGVTTLSHVLGTGSYTSLTKPSPMSSTSTASGSFLSPRPATTSPTGSAHVSATSPSSGTAAPASRTSPSAPKP